MIRHYSVHHNRRKQPQRSADRRPAVALLAGILCLFAGCRSPQHEARDLIQKAGGTIRWKKSQVVGISLHDVDGVAALLAKLTEIDTVEELDLSRSSADDRAIAAIPSWPLRRLDLRATRITDACMLEIGKLRTLEVLSLTETRVSQLQELAALSQLVELGLPPQADDAALKIVANLSHLRTLFASKTRIAGPGLSHLTPDRLPELKSLYLSGTNLTDGSTAGLPVHPTLERVTFMDTAVGDATAQHLSSFPRIDYLSFASTRLSDAGLEHLRKLPLLYVLDVPGTQVTLEGVQRLEKMRPSMQIAHTLTE